MNLYGLTEADLRWLKTNIAELREVVANRSRPGMESSWSDREDHQAPESYVARPLDSYANYYSNNLGTGTGGPDSLLPALVPATGTGSFDYDVPGMAKCAIYRVIDDAFGNPTLRPLGGAGSEDHYQWVYNVTTQSATNKFFPITRDKYGFWIPMLGGSSAEIIRFQVLSAGSFYDDTSVECNTVIAEVLDISCGGSGVSVGDEITVWDPSGCWFSIPIENIENSYGIAQRMNKGGDFAIDECTQDNDSAGCFWMVINLCCAEEVLL